LDADSQMGHERRLELEWSANTDVRLRTMEVADRMSDAVTIKV